jgi:hypothetical protein
LNTKKTPDISSTGESKVGKNERSHC